MSSFCLDFVDASATLLATAVDLYELLRSFLFPYPLIGPGMVSNIFDERIWYCKWVKEVAECTRLWTVPFLEPQSRCWFC